MASEPATWEKITPEELIAAIKRIREIFDLTYANQCVSTAISLIKSAAETHRNGSSQP
jgi:hypothetical protein